MTTWYQINDRDCTIYSEENEISESTWAALIEACGITDEHTFEYSVHEGVHMYVFHEPEEVAEAVAWLHLELEDLKATDFRITSVPRSLG